MNQTVQVPGVNRASAPCVIPSRRPLARALGQALPGAVLLSAGLLASPALLAATYQVTNIGDSGAGSLRDAINQANANPGADTITFSSSVTGTIGLTSGTLLITDDLDIQGPGAAALTVDGSGISVPLTGGRHHGGKGENGKSGGSATNGVPGTGTSVFTVGSGSPPGGNATQQAQASFTVSISGLTISGGTSTDGGGIYAYDTDLTVSQCVVSGNTATDLGGGIAVRGYSASLLLTDSTVSNNTAFLGGGVGTTSAAITIQRSTIANNTATTSSYYGGGGIMVHNDNNNMLTVTDSTISGNSSSYNGGGIMVRHTAANISNSTVTGNTAANYGGGLYFHGVYSGTTVTNSTITGNQASYGGGLSTSYSSSYASASNSAFGGNSASGSDPDMHTANSYIVLDHSLVQAPGGATITDNGGNLMNQAPMLGGLANNGGPTLTHLPLAGSPLIDAGDPAFTGPPNNDQRGAGYPRIVNGVVDIGATEYAAAAPPGPGPVGYVPVPGLGDAGKLGLGALLGLAGLAVARRRRALAPRRRA